MQVLDDELFGDDLTVDDLGIHQAGPSHHVPLLPAKKRKAEDSDELVCDLVGCPSAASGYAFKNTQNLSKHQQ